MAEESDVNEFGVPMSHYEMYLEAMDQVNADTSAIGLFVNAIENGDSIETAAKEINLETPVLEFIQFTMEVVNSNKPHCIASAFTFGREDVIPDMFLEIVSREAIINELQFGDRDIRKAELEIAALVQEKGISEEEASPRLRQYCGFL